MSAIKTPDQRVRVFISSTIGELADERKAATEAIKKLRLTPVLFELGARPHPPRELYRAYLEQSHIFVGIYWNSYGWIAPDMTISGLEDEYILSEGKTRLIYVKQSSGNRDEKLGALLKQIEKSGNVCYRNFSAAEELRELLENDLALLLSEKFEQPVQKPEQKSSLPVMHTPLLGRERELRELEELITRTEVGLVTLTGTGGTGKTRLAIQLAHNIKDRFKDGLYYVPLASVTDEKLLPAMIAHVMGLFDSGKQAIKTTLFDCLCDKHILLVLDNFEQIVGAAVVLSEILERCNCIKIVVTSRTPLHIRGEYIVPIQPLQHPEGERVFSSNEILKFPSVELFIQRARAVNPHLPLDDENVRAISEICRRLDGLPLAIELAASRTKFLSPVALQSRMNKTLDLLSHGHRDLPDRQKTLRATIDWSYNLLEPSCQNLFRQLSVFSDGWTLDSAQALAQRLRTIDCDIMDATEKLLDFGLIRTFSYYNERDATVEPRFTMLQTVLEYATDMLLQSGETQAVKKAHTEYFIELAEQVNPDAWLVSDNPAFDRIERDYQNLRAAFWNSLEANRHRDAWRVVRALNHCWMIRGRFGEAAQWIEAASIAHDSTVLGTLITKEDKVIFAGALLSSGIVMFSVGNYEKAKRDLSRSVELFSELGMKSSLARATIYQGVTHLSCGEPVALEILTEAKRIGRENNDPYSIIAASATLAEAAANAGKLEMAQQLMDEAERLSMQTGNSMMSGLAMMQKGNLLNALGKFADAIPAFSASLQLYKQSGFKIISSWANVGMGHSYREMKDLENAKREYDTAIRNARLTGENVIAAAGMLGLSGIALAHGEHLKAARLLGKVDASIKAIGYSFWVSDRNLHEAVATTLRNVLSETEFTTAYEFGKKMTMEQAVALSEEGAMNVGMP